jgi:hypothetical protein
LKAISDNIINFYTPVTENVSYINVQFKNNTSFHINSVNLSTAAVRHPLAALQLCGVVTGEVVIEGGKQPCIKRKGWKAKAKVPNPHGHMLAKPRGGAFCGRTPPVWRALP